MVPDTLKPPPHAAGFRPLQPSGLAPLGASPSNSQLLSQRELEVLHLIASGASNREIADQLVVAVSTVKRHINNIFGKLDVHSRTQLLARARELRLLP